MKIEWSCRGFEPPPTPSLIRHCA